jgi:hypothetical protein
MGIEARHSYRFGYLQTDHWKDLRVQKLASQDACCLFCGLRDPSNDVHHVHYPKDLNDTKLGHLRVLCRKHHKRVHELMNEMKLEDGAESKIRDDFDIFRKICERIDREMEVSGEKRFLDRRNLSIKSPKHSREKTITSWETDKCPHSVGDRRRGRHKEIFKAFRKAVYVMDLIADDPEYFNALPESIRAEYIIKRAGWIDFMDRLNGAELRDITHRE